jgi:hypothetical protein
MLLVAKRCSFFLGAMALFATVSAAGTIPVGFLSWDVIFPGNAGQFDITNLTGTNNDVDFPITTTVNLSSLTLVVDFAGGTSQTFGPGSGYFTLSADGQSFDGSAIPIGGTNPLPIDVTLTGTFSPLSVSLNTGGGSMDILPDFSVTFSDDPTLVDGDLGVIFATTGTVSGTPEPGTWMLFAIGMAALTMARSRIVFRGLRTMLTSAPSLLSKGLLPVLCLIAGQSAFGQVSLAGSTTPSSGVAGVTSVSLTGSSFPAGTITPGNVVVTLATSCGGPAVKTTTAASVKKVLGSTDRVSFAIPSGILTGNYYVTIADSAASDADFTTKPGSCSIVSVTGSSPVLNACVAGSSMGVLLPAGGAPGNVTAYVPKGWWGGFQTGVFAKNIEGTSGPSTTIPTTNVTNSCSSNPATGQTVCVANNTDVYLISGTALNTTLTSGSNTLASFSGGSCNNCGVAVNANNNTAVINMGITGGASNSGVQILDLTNHTFKPAFPMANTVSENISVDPTRSLVLSAGEGGNFTLNQIQADGSLKEFSSSFNTGEENDSSAEDCSTGIGLAPGEFTNNVVLANLNAISFGVSTYTAPNATVTLDSPGFGGFSAGLSGSAVAQGSGHLAVVTGEFGGSTFAVLKLPATAGTTVPSLVDYAIAQIPSNAACGGGFSAGFDPHTITAYTSPNNGDSFAVFAGYSGGVPTCLAVVDMTTVINPTLSPRGGGFFGANEISPANLPASAVTFFPL